MKRGIIVIYVLLAIVNNALATPIDLNKKKLSSPPPRIVRQCCAFGADVGVIGVPYLKITHVTSKDNIGNHVYLGGKKEGNGLIYTEKGGFIDLGHLRDQADWVAYVYALIRFNLQEGYNNKKLGYEGGQKILTFDIPANIDSIDAILLAGKITYDLSVWHEIATWFGVSTVPGVPERFSSFSVEDVYSNLLGVNLGIKALKSHLPFEEAMTALLAETLDSLGAVSTADETNTALEKVRDIWWTKEKRIPHREVLVERHWDAYNNTSPWLVPGWTEEEIEPCHQEIPLFSTDGTDLNKYYKLKIELNFKFPFEEIFPERTDKTITQEDFDKLLIRVGTDLAQSISHKDVKSLEALRLHDKNTSSFSFIK